VRQLPSGTVTFLFTDIEGSTRLLHELGNAYAEALADHRRRLRDAFVKHRGVEVDTQGDAFFVAFERASDALAAADYGRRALEGGPIRVRMGLHTGEPQLTDEGYVGVDVHKGARIAAAGHGGQILVSQTTRDLAGADGLVDLGEHRLKDLSAPERIYQLGEGEFPPLKTLYQTNLPVPATPFVGRERELADVGELLTRPDVRLLTLTGAGGSGKTRLALQAAGAAADAYPHGVWWVPLAPVADEADVADAVVRALGGSGSIESTLAERKLLLVLDNFEHVIGAASAIGAAVGACPHVDMLVTSRERLQLAPEHVYPVPVLARAEARELFVARALATNPTFAASASVDELCARLDDLPLALELAAARTVVLSAEQLVERLGQRLDLLRGGRDTDVRQQTLRATIQWSYDLLDLEEQRLLAALAVFRGGCTLEAAEAVSGADLVLLQSLVDKSLVRVRDGGRFWMLETIREFALERLRDSEEEEALRRAHAEFFLALAEASNLSADNTDLGQRYELVIPEQDNIRAALDWALEVGDAAFGVRLFVGGEQFWVAQAPHEGLRRIAALAADPKALPPEARARALRVRSGLTYIIGRFEEGIRLAEQAVEEFRSLGDELAVAHMLQRLAVEAARVGDGGCARELAAESLRMSHERHSPSGEALALGILGRLEADAGRLEQALELALRSAAGAAEVGFTWFEVHALYEALEYMLRLGRTGDAERTGFEALRLAAEIGERQMLVYLLALLARISVLGDRHERAGVLWGAVEAEENRGPVGQWEGERDAYATPVLAETGTEFERGRERGRKLSLSEAVAYASSSAAD
jgi:predicted ATPase